MQMIEKLIQESIKKQMDLNKFIKSKNNLQLIEIFWSKESGVSLKELEKIIRINSGYEGEMKYHTLGFKITNKLFSRDLDDSVLDFIDHQEKITVLYK